MFDIGFWELVLISVVGLVVLGPERLPHAIRSVSRFIGAAKNMANSVKDELSHELKVQELQENLRKAEQMGMEDLSPELKSSVEELKKAAQSVNRPYADKRNQKRNLQKQNQWLKVQKKWKRLRFQRQIRKPNSLIRRSY